MRLLVVLALCVAACKGNPEKCDKAIRHYAELVFWEQADAEIAAAPPEQRDELRKKKLAEFTANMEKGIHLVTSQCVSATGMSDSQVDCMLAAKTAKQAKECATPQ